MQIGERDVECEEEICQVNFSYTMDTEALIANPPPFDAWIFNRKVTQVFTLDDGNEHEMSQDLSFTLNFTVPETSDCEITDDMLIMPESNEYESTYEWGQGMSATFSFSTIETLQFGDCPPLYWTFGIDKGLTIIDTIFDNEWNDIFSLIGLPTVTECGNGSCKLMVNY